MLCPPQMLAVKDERKRAEYDVQLLANRLAYLRAEERAANKKVADTKKRTQDIAAAKKHAADKEKVPVAPDKRSQINIHFLFESLAFL